MQPYKDARKVSQELYERACAVMPGGDTRSVTYFEPYPSFMQSGRGCRIQDVDHNEYIDFLNNYTALVLGHAHPAVVKAVCEQIQQGTAFPAPLEKQIELSEILTRRIKSLDMVRFCNSGSEANIQAIRAARTYTGKKKVVKVLGGYHGGFDFAQYIDIPFNNIEKAEDTIRKHREEIACVIVEPILGRGMIPAKKEFLCCLREIASECDAIFILDEVITFRLDTGGVQALYSIEPDITTLGKMIGGGFPVGAFGGREDIMMLFSPDRKEFIHHSGSFNGNPVTMTAGVETLKILDAEAVKTMNTMGDSLRKGLEKMIKDEVNAKKEDSTHQISVSGKGSLLHFHFAPQPALSTKDFDSQDNLLFSQLHMAMLMDGIYMAPRGMFNLSLAMNKEEIQRFIESARRSILHIVSG